MLVFRTLHNTLEKFSKTELWLNTHKLSFRTLDFIRSEDNPRCCDLIVAMDYAAHSLVEWLL